MGKDDVAFANPSAPAFIQKLRQKHGLKYDTRHQWSSYQGNTQLNQQHCNNIQQRSITRLVVNEYHYSIIFIA